MKFVRCQAYTNMFWQNEFELLTICIFHILQTRRKNHILVCKIDNIPLKFSKLGKLLQNIMYNMGTQFHKKCIAI